MLTFAALTCVLITSGVGGGWRGGETLMTTVDIIDLAESNGLEEIGQRVVGHLQLDLEEPAVGIAVTADYAYLATEWSAEFRVLEVSEPGKALVVGSRNPAGTLAIGRALAVADQALYFSAPRDWLWRSSLVDPPHPEVVDSLPAAGSVAAIATVTNGAETWLAYSQCGARGGLRIFTADRWGFSEWASMLAAGRDGRAVVFGDPNTIYQLNASAIGENDADDDADGDGCDAVRERIDLLVWRRVEGARAFVAEPGVHLGTTDHSRAVVLAVAADHRHLLVGPLNEAGLLVIDTAAAGEAAIVATLDLPGQSLVALTPIPESGGQILAATRSRSGEASELRILHTAGAPDEWTSGPPLTHLGGVIHAVAVALQAGHPYAYVSRGAVPALEGWNSQPPSATFGPARPR